MKNMSILFMFFFFSSKLLSQDITYFFQNLPDSCMLNLSKEDRKKIVKNHSDDSFVTIGYNFYKFIAKDNKFGQIVGSMAGTYELKLWELSNRSKLILIHGVCFAPPCCPNIIQFYQFNGKRYKFLNDKDIFPFEDILQNFFDDNYEENISKLNQENIFGFPCIKILISPEKSNIYVYLDITDDRSKYEKYGIIGDRMELIWNDGKFTKGKVYWSEKE